MSLPPLPPLNSGYDPETSLSLTTPSSVTADSSNPSFRPRSRIKPLPMPPTIATPHDYSSIRQKSFVPWLRIRSRITNIDDSPHDNVHPFLPSAAARVPSKPTPSTFHNITTPTPPTAHPAIPRRLLTDAPPHHYPPVRNLLRPSSSTLLQNNSASVTHFLRSVTLPLGCLPESTDISFKPHANLLRRTSLHHFELNRYLFAYKPLARVNAVMAATLLAPGELDAKTFPMSATLRTAVMYLAGNAYRNVYVMTYAAQLKSIHRPRPAAEGIMNSVLLENQHLTPHQGNALNFAHELLSHNFAVSQATKLQALEFEEMQDGLLERLVTGTTAYGAFLSCLTNPLDLELTHAAIQYAAENLEGLPWKSSGAPMNVSFMDDDMNDFSTSAKHHSGITARLNSKRDRFSLNKNYDRHSHSSPSKTRPKAIQRMSQFLSSSFIAPKTINDVQRVTDIWMKAAKLPAPGHLFEENDYIRQKFGFDPFYFSTTAMAGESMRRAFLYGVTELLFRETEIPKRLKFIICYVLSSSKERRRIDVDHKRSFESQGVHNGRSIASVYSHREYDALSIMSAHAAFLACKYGSNAAELVAATDVSRVRSAMEKYQRDPALSTRVRLRDFPLPRRDCASILLTHALLQESTYINNKDLISFEESFGAAVKATEHGNRPSRRAFLEIIGTCCMWGAIERYATGTLGFDIDCSSNLVFGEGRAEATIVEFCKSSEGRKIGLSLGVEDNKFVDRHRLESKAKRSLSLRHGMHSKKKLVRKRTNSMLHTGLRIGRVVGSEDFRSQTNSAMA